MRAFPRPCYIPLTLLPTGRRRAQADTSPDHRPRPLCELIASHASPPGCLSANPVNTHSDWITLLSVRNPKSHHQANAHVAWIGDVPEKGFNIDLLQGPTSCATNHPFQSPGQRVLYLLPRIPSAHFIASGGPSSLKSTIVVLGRALKIMKGIRLWGAPVGT